MKNIIVLSLIFLLQSCTQTTYVEKGTVKSNIPLINKVVYDISDQFSDYKINCIAVLPFKDNREKKDQIFDLKENPIEVVRESFYSHLSPLAYQDIEIKRIDYLMTEKNMNEKNILSYLQEHNCNSYIKGSIEKLHISDLKIYSNTTLEIQVYLYDIKTDDILWEAKKIAKSSGGDIPLHPISLLTGAYKAYQNTQIENIFKLIDSVNRQLVSTLPQGKINNFDTPKMIVDAKINQSTIEENKKNNENDPDFLKDLIKFNLSSGRYEDAKELSIKAIEIHNTHEFYFFAGRALLKLKEYEKSEKMFIKAIALNPDEYMYYNALGYLYSFTKKSGKSIGCLPNGNR